MVSTRWNKFRSLIKKNILFIHAFNHFREELHQNPVQLFSVPLPHSNALPTYVKREKCKVNDVIFPPGCEARAIVLGNKNVKIGIFTGATSVRSKNIFTDISRYPTGKCEISYDISFHITLSSSGRFPFTVYHIYCFNSGYILQCISILGYR